MLYIPETQNKLRLMLFPGDNAKMISEALWSVKKAGTHATAVQLLLLALVYVI